MIDQKELRCHTEGCGHKLVFHEISPKARCRVALCRCDKWRVHADPPPERELRWPEDWQKRTIEAVKEGHIVVFAPPDLGDYELRLEIVRRALFPETATLLHMRVYEDDDVG